MYLFVRTSPDRVLLVISISLIATFVTDISLLRTYDLVPKNLLAYGVAIYMAIVIVFSIGQYFVLMVLRYRTSNIRSKNRPLLLIERGMITIQYVLIASLAFIVLQIALFQEFSTHVLSFSIAVSFGMGAFNLAALGKLFLSWVRQNMQGTLMFYSLSSIVIALFAILTSVFIFLTLSYKPQTITPFLGGSTIYIPTYSVANTLDYVNFSLSIVSFLLTWIATFFLVKPYSKKLGEIKFALIISLPLVFFIFQFPIQFSDSFIMMFASGTAQYAIILTLVFTFIKLLGAIMFGISFWFVVKNLDPILPVRGFMIIAGMGFVFLFITNQSAAIIVAPYPPYGLSTFLFFALSSYMVLAGVYGSAISLAEDSRLRKTVRNFVETKLLDDIGLASVQKEIYDRSSRLFKEYKDELFENEGLNTSLTENEIQSYVAEVVKLKESELKKRDRDSKE